MTADEVVALEHAFMDAVQRRDVAYLGRRLHPRFTLTTGRPGAEVRARDEWLAITRDRYVIDEWSFDDVATIELGNVVVVRARYRQRGSMDGVDRSQPFLLTDVWAESVDGPVLVSRHASPLPPRDA